MVQLSNAESLILTKTVFCTDELISFTASKIQHQIYIFLTRGCNLQRVKVIYYIGRIKN